MPKTDLIPVFTVGTHDCYPLQGPVIKGTFNKAHDGVFGYHHNLDYVLKAVSEVIRGEAHSRPTPFKPATHFVRVEQMEVESYLVDNQFNLSQEECTELAQAHGFEFTKRSWW